ncbi:helix-turn-helix transcriptional regulator [Actinocatenispora thailandica]|nr:LuxR family transcriptional regulator [Actinocatenispora thailandica]
MAAGGVIGAEDRLAERTSAIDALRRRIDALGDGQSGAVLVAGPAGMGRSALLARAAADARAAGIAVVQIRFARPVPDAPGTVPAPGTPGSALGPGTVGSALGPGTVGSAPGPGTVESDPPGSVGIPAALMREAEAGLATATPTLLAVDDVHRAGPAGLRWLTRLACRSGGGPALVVCGVASWFRWATGRCADLTAPHRIQLRPLSFAGVREVCVRLAGPVPDEYVQAVAAASRGNPALVHAIVRRCPHTTAGPALLPRLSSVTADVIAGYVDRVYDGVPAELTGLLQAVAVAGRELPFGSLCELAGVDAVDLDRLLATGLFAYTDRLHPVWPEVVDRILGRLGPTELPELYRRAAEIGRTGAVDDHVLAEWLDLAGSRRPAWAVEVLTDVGWRAARDGRRDTAVRLLGRALDTEGDGPRRGALLLALGTTELSVSPDAGERHLGTLLRDPSLHEVAHRLAAADLLSLGGSDCRPALRAGLRSARSDAERAGLLGLSWLAHPRGYEDDEDAWLTRGELPSAAQLAGRAWWLTVRAEERTAALAIARAAAATPLFHPRLVASRVLLLADDLAGAGEVLDSVLADATRARADTVLIHALLVYAELSYRQGHLTAGEQALERALRHLAPHAWPPAVLRQVVAVQMMLDIEQERFDAAQELAELQPSPAGSGGFGWSALLYARGVLELRRERMGVASALLHECGRRMSADGLDNPALLNWRAYAAVADAASDRPRRAARLIADALVRAEAWGAPSALGLVRVCAGQAFEGQRLSQLRSAVDTLRGCLSRLRYARALVDLAAAAAAVGDVALAVSSAREAEQLAASHGWPPVLHRAAAILQRCQRGAGPALSAAQRAVAELAASGLSNKQIAQRRRVSLRTVELHLTNTYRQLGIRRRAELAAALDRAVRAGAGGA